MRIGFLGNFRVDYTSETHHANSLELLGHSVIRLQETEATAAQIAALDIDLFVWIKTHGWNTPGDMGRTLKILRARGIPSMSYHLDLYMGLGRWARYKADPYLMGLDHFFTVDRLMADWLCNNTPVFGHYLPAAVYGPECYVGQPDSPHGNDVIFVGSKGYHPEWPYRPKLIDWLRNTYGARFTHVGGDGDTGTIRGDALNRVYATSKVAVGDTLCLNYDYPDYWSDRVYETLGRGGFLIHPHIQGMERTFTDREHLVFYRYGDFDQLHDLIDEYLEDSDARKAIQANGQALVKTSETYSQRWESIIDTVFG